MKKRLLVFLALTCLVADLTSCHRSMVAAPPAGVRILLVDPSPSDIDGMVKKIQQRIITIDRPVLVAVYHEDTERNPQGIAKMLESIEPPPLVEVETLSGALEAGNLFQRNGCSDAFYRLFKNSEAAIFFGGDDIPPVAYGQKTSLLTGISTPMRHYFELSFLFHLLGGSQNSDFKPFMEEKPEFMVYGFCLGMQTMNAATGGTLYQDIPSEVYHLRYVEEVLEQESAARHRNYHHQLDPRADLFWCQLHPIRFIPDGWFVDKMKRAAQEQPLICSSHHQAVKDLGRDLVIAATSLDGRVVEAITHARYPNVLGVQFHPEAFAIYDSTGARRRLSPADSAAVTLHDYLKEKNSLAFHQAFWRTFSDLLQK